MKNILTMHFMKSNHFNKNIDFFYFGDSKHIQIEMTALRYKAGAYK